MSQQTAVTFLIEKVKSKEWQDMFIWHKEEIFEQAKQMEKERMIKFADEYGFHICGYDYERAEQYYKETYITNKG